MAHCTNLAAQTLLGLLLVKHIESLLQTLHAYFAHSFKWHLEFTKFDEVMERKGNKIVCNVKTRWISMLSFAKKLLAEYKTLLVKMAMDSFTNHQTKFNYEHLCDLQILLELSCIFPLLEFVHVFIKFAQIWNVFVCDLVVAINVCQTNLFNMYYDENYKFFKDSF
jgi:hypothetical protein